VVQKVVGIDVRCCRVCRRICRAVCRRVGRDVTLGTSGVTSMVEIRQLLCSFRSSISAAAGTFVGAGEVGFVYSIRLSFARVTVQKQS
jgi:hypothetical protein